MLPDFPGGSRYLQVSKRFVKLSQEKSHGWRPLLVRTRLTLSYASTGQHEHREVILKLACVAPSRFWNYPFQKSDLRKDCPWVKRTEEMRAWKSCVEEKCVVKARPPRGLRRSGLLDILEEAGFPQRMTSERERRRRASVAKISAKCCSFSVVSAPIFARKYAFFSIF